MTEIIFPDVDLDKVKGVLVDLDNTLYNFDNAHLLALKACYDNYDYGTDFTVFKDMYKKHRAFIMKKLDYKPACRSRMLIFQNMAETLKIKCPYIHGLKQAECYWKNFIRNIKADKKALCFLKKCKKLKIPVCVVTDMLSEMQVQKIKKLKISSYITFLASSEEATEEKPHRMIFDLALSKIKLETSDVIMIGDNKEKDIKGAEALNIKSYLVKVIG